MTTCWARGSARRLPRGSFGNAGVGRSLSRSIHIISAIAPWLLIPLVVLALPEVLCRWDATQPTCPLAVSPVGATLRSDELCEVEKLSSRGNQQVMLGDSVHRGRREWERRGAFPGGGTISSSPTRLSSRREPRMGCSWILTAPVFHSRVP